MFIFQLVTPASNTNVVLTKAEQIHASAIQFLISGMHASKEQISTWINEGLFNYLYSANRSSFKENLVEYSLGNQTQEMQARRVSYYNKIVTNQGRTDKMQKTFASKFKLLTYVSGQGMSLDVTKLSESQILDLFSAEVLNSVKNRGENGSLNSKLITYLKENKYGTDIRFLLPFEMKKLFSKAVFDKAETIQLTSSQNETTRNLVQGLNCVLADLLPIYTLNLKDFDNLDFKNMDKRVTLAITTTDNTVLKVFDILKQVMQAMRTGGLQKPSSLETGANSYLAIATDTVKNFVTLSEKKQEEAYDQSFGKGTYAITSNIAKDIAIIHTNLLQTQPSPIFASNTKAPPNAGAKIQQGWFLKEHQEKETNDQKEKDREKFA